MNFLKSILPIPKHRYNDLFEDANYRITLNFSFFLCIVLSFLYITQLVSFDTNRSNLILLAVIFSFIFYIYTLKTGQYKIPSLIGSYTYTLIIEFSLYAIPKNPPIIAGLWMLNNIFFTYRCVNKLNGLVISLIHSSSLIFFYTTYQTNRNELLYQNLILDEKISVSFNLLFAFLVFIFFIHQTIETNLKASQKIKFINNEIYNQFKIIDNQNEEKTTLLKEIHHRVKNNLQIIISLLRLQSNKIDDLNTKQLFNIAINRIYSISSIHEKIYQNNDFRKINIKEYFEDLTKEIISLNELNFNIKTKLNFQVESINIEPIVPLALILNELISNSIKHFDSSINQLSIEIELNTKDLNSMVLIYSDNGRWGNTEEKKTLGLELIETLTKQINGTLEIFKTPKTQFCFIFRNIL